MKGNELAGELVSAQSAMRQLNPDKLVAGTRDISAVNRVAMQHNNVNETILYSHMSDVSLPSRKNTAKIILTVQPSSATAERVLPLLQATTSGQQLQLLEDSLQLAIMLQYNHGRNLVA